MDVTERLILCDNVNELLEEAKLGLEDRLSVLGSVTAGLLRANLSSPGQRIIHLHTLYVSMSKYLDEEACLSEKPRVGGEA